MSLLSDKQITHLCQHHEMITPFSPISRTDIAPGLIGPSYGLSSTGYDIRLSDKWMTPVYEDESFNSTSMLGLLLSGVAAKETAYTTYRKADDPIDPNLNVPMREVTADIVVLRPGEFALAVSIEHFKMPADTMGICTGKSTLARMGLIVLVTPLECGWEGYLTLELFNAGAYPIHLHSGIGICQINFFKTDEVPHKSYMHRSGKYQGQKAHPVAARLG